MREIKFDRIASGVDSNLIITIPKKQQELLYKNNVVKIELKPYYKEYISINTDFKPIIFFDKLKSLGSVKDNKRLYFSIPKILSKVYSFYKKMAFEVIITTFNKDDVFDIDLTKRGVENEQ